MKTNVFSWATRAAYMSLSLMVLILTGCAGMTSGGFKQGMAIEKAPEQLAKCPASCGTVHLERVVPQEDYPTYQAPAPIVIGERVVSSSGCFEVIPVKEGLPGQPPAPQPKTDYVLRYTYAGESNMDSTAGMAVGAFIPFAGLVTHSSQVGQVSIALYRGEESIPLFTAEAATEKSEWGSIVGRSGQDAATGYPGGKQYAASFAAAYNKIIPQVANMARSATQKPASVAVAKGDKKRK